MSRAAGASPTGAWLADCQSVPERTAALTATEAITASSAQAMQRNAGRFLSTVRILAPRLKGIQYPSLRRNRRAALRRPPAAPEKTGQEAKHLRKQSI